MDLRGAAPKLFFATACLALSVAGGVSLSAYTTAGMNPVGNPALASERPVYARPVATATPDSDWRDTDGYGDIDRYGYDAEGYRTGAAPPQEVADYVPPDR